MFKIILDLIKYCCYRENQITKNNLLGHLESLADHEMEAVQAAERAAEERERQRKLRAAQHDMLANDYFERMKRLVITEK